MSDSKVLLSTVVLTYRRDEALVESLARLKELTGERDDHLLILVDNNGDGVDRSWMLKGFARSKYVALPHNVGVTGGRNAGIQNAEGELILFLDDDAYIEGPEDLCEALEREFCDDASLGIIAFRSVVGPDRIDDPAEFPHTDKKLSRDTRFQTFRFIGVAHAMRLAVLKDAGRYRDEFFYGMEEFDMSFRFMKLGYRIFFDPRFRVHHRKAPSGRLRRKDVLHRMYLNKLRTAWMHLPFPQALVCASAWAVKTAIDARSIVPSAAAFAEFLRWAREHRTIRRPSKDAVRTIDALGGTAWR